MTGMTEITGRSSLLASTSNSGLSLCVGGVSLAGSNWDTLDLVILFIGCGRGLSFSESGSRCSMTETSGIVSHIFLRYDYLVVLFA